MTSIYAQCDRVEVSVRDYVGANQKFRALRIEGFESGKVISIDLYLPAGVDPILKLEPVTLEIPA